MDGVVTLHFGRFRVHDSETFDTLDEALEFARAQEDLGNIYAERVEMASGSSIEHDELRALLSSDTA